MASIFISYRREDAGGHAGRLCDRLNAWLGADHVFMDVEDMRPGQDFVRAIDDTVSKCDFVLVMIGPRWLETMRTRAMADTDFVKHEILSALKRGIAIIPVLVGGATMPDGRQLPPEIAELSRRHAVEIRDGHFDDDAGRLIEFLGGSVGRQQPPVAAEASFSRRRLVAGGAMLALAVGAAAFLAWRPDSPALIGGEWIAEMQNLRKQTFRIGLTLVEIPGGFTGMVRYPTGDGAILEGVRNGDTITFHTSHVPQFESEPAIIRFTGTVERDGIQLIATDVSGVATGVARRAPPPP